MSNELFHNKVCLLGFVLYYQKSRKYFVVVFIQYIKCMLYQILLQFCILSIICLNKREKKLNQSFEFNWVESKLLLSSWFFKKSAYILFVSECLGHFQPGCKWKEIVSVLWVLRGWYGMSQWSVSHVLWRHRGPLWPRWLAVLSQWRVFLNGSATFCPWRIFYSSNL